MTFLSANIVNKDALEGKVNMKELNGTFLTQLSWIIPAIFQGLPNVILENPVLACKANNTGGYQLFKVFGENLNGILSAFVQKGYDKNLKKIINNKLLDSFFPFFFKFWK